MSIRTKIEDIRKIAEDNNCKLLTTNYKNVNQKLDWQCNKCTHEFKKTLATCKINSLKCPRCNPKKTWNKGKKGVSEETAAKMRIAKEGYVPWNKGVQMTDEQRIKLSCVNQGISVDDFNGFKTPEERKLRLEFEQHPVKIECLKNNNYTCQYCKTVGTILHAHHANSWKFFPEQRFDIDNLICLCDGCHRSFHSIYGNGKKSPNTRQQLDDFLNTSSNHKHHIYIVSGAPGSGKTWVCNQLKDRFTYLPIDIYKKSLNYELCSAPEPTTFLIDPTATVSTYIKRLKQKHNVSFIAILENEDIIVKRLKERGGKFTKSVKRRIKRMESMSKIANFSGTAEEVLNYLK